MDKDLKELKRKVGEDWQRAFPDLTLFSQNKLYKIIGPLLVGIELIKLPGSEAYRPHFVIYALWGNKMGNNLKACLTGPILLKEYYNRKGLQFSIPYENNEAYFAGAVESVKEKIPVPFNGNIGLGQLLSALDDYSRTSPLSAAPESYLQAALQEAKFKAALYVDISEAQSILEEIGKRNWDVNHFNMSGNDVGNWLKGLKEQVNQRNEFLLTIGTNKRDRKLEKLNHSELEK